MKNMDFKISAIENHFNNKHHNLDDDSYINNLEILIKNSISFIAKYTKYSEEELLNLLNQNVTKIEFFDCIDDDSNLEKLSIEDHKNKVLRFHRDSIYSVLKSDEIQKVVTYELIKALSRREEKKIMFKNVLEFGYEVVNEKEASKKEECCKKAFNEAVVEILANKGEQYQAKGYIGFNIYTNFNQPGNAINSNLIKQMITANGINEEDLIDGLFNRESCEIVIKSFDEDSFNEIVKAMDLISNLCDKYGVIQNEFGDTNQDDHMESSFVQAMNKAGIKENIRQIERLIIDKILMQRLQGKNEIERKRILDEYKKYIISEKKYFEKITGYDFGEYDDEVINKEFCEEEIEEQSKEFNLDDEHEL